MQRRKFLFWASFGMFSVGEALGVAELDRLAAATMRIGNRRRRPSSNNSTNNPSNSAIYRETNKPIVLEDATHEFVEQSEPLVERPETEAEKKPGEPHPNRLARHGRPPSQWLRSLEADELRVWLKTIEVNEAGVSGMTYWVHLTRDHYFDPVKIEGLTIDEQSLLHAAAHAGY